MFRKVAGTTGRSRRSLGLRSIVLSSIVLGLPACGDGGGSRSAVRLDAADDGSLRFEREAVAAPAGRASIDMGNPSDIPHAIGVRGRGIGEIGETVGSDGTSSVEVELEPGVYELFCPVGGHERAGMTATLTVR